MSPQTSGKKRGKLIPSKRPVWPTFTEYDMEEVVIPFSARILRTQVILRWRKIWIDSVRMYTYVCVVFGPTLTTVKSKLECKRLSFNKIVKNGNL